MTMPNCQKPTIALTIGDPAGVGPELALRCVRNESVLASCVPVLIGDQQTLRRVARLLRLPMPDVVMNPSDGLRKVNSPAAPAIFDMPSALDGLEAGTFNAQTGMASYQYVCSAIDAAMDGKVDAIVTGPIQKEAWHAASIEFPGHTELLAQRTGAARCCMMLTSPMITCALVTVHVGLEAVASQLSIEGIVDTIELAHAAVSSNLGSPARVTVCGLNPHAGESGLFGNREEERYIVPAIERARAIGIDVSGPLPADTAFVPAVREKTDVYVCMYHDQGLIPLKMMAFDDAVNVTLGLPIIRTSVDHGTAADIAWQGLAKESSMIEAIKLAAQLAISKNVADVDSHSAGA